VYDPYANPVLTAELTPLFWRYDFDYQNNQYLME
jgi:4-O-beta-D-mannosyl-D-glucose phosphorylase